MDFPSLVSVKNRSPGSKKLAPWVLTPSLSFSSYSQVYILKIYFPEIRVLPCSSNWPGTHYVDYIGQKYTCLCLPSPETKCVYHLFSCTCLFLFYVCMWVSTFVYVNCMCAWYLQGPEGFLSPRTGATGCYKPPYGCWELNLSTLQEQQVVLAPEPSLQPQIYILLRRVLCDI